MQTPLQGMGVNMKYEVRSTKLEVRSKKPAANGPQLKLTQYNL